jgi:hypothetical protein
MVVKAGFWRSKRFIALLAIIILVPSVLLIVMKVDIGLREQESEDELLEYFSKQTGMSEAFAQLEQLTPAGSVVLCWWDYGRAVSEWSNREAIESYPSRDIWNRVAQSQSLWHTLGAQLFGTWGSSKKIHDIAAMFMLPEIQSLPVMRDYNVSYVLVFVPDELQKFSWIASIAGYNPTDYLIQEQNEYQPTELGTQTTLLRLIFDDDLSPQYFTKVFDNGKAKIYQVDY